MDAAKNTLEFGKDWEGMLNYLAESESLVDVYLIQPLFGFVEIPIEHCMPLVIV
jgi:hypothetical protein